MPTLRQAPAAAALPHGGAHACSDCACLPVVPDKPLLCTHIVRPITSESTQAPVTRALRRLRARRRRRRQIYYSDAAFK